MPGRDATAWTKRGSGCAPALLGAGGCLAPNRRHIDLDRWGSSASGGLSATGVSGDTQTLRSSVAGGEALNRERRGRSARMRRSRRLPQTIARTANPPAHRSSGRLSPGRVVTPRGCRTRRCVPPRANAYAEGWAAEPAQLAVDCAGPRSRSRSPAAAPAFGASRRRPHEQSIPQKDTNRTATHLIRPGLRANAQLSCNGRFTDTHPATPRVRTSPGVSAWLDATVEPTVSRLSAWSAEFRGRGICSVPSTMARARSDSRRLSCQEQEREKHEDHLSADASSFVAAREGRQPRSEGRTARPTPAGRPCRSMSPR
jgi:hypothetical protein